jgi:lysophospholipase L1-like esterase
LSTLRFAALGDSITVGMGDPMPDGSWRGWAALAAECLGPPGSVEFHNLAEPGALSLTLPDRQLPAALGLRPTLAALIVGANDTLRGTFDIGRTGRALNHAVAALRASGAVVLTARLPDPGRLLRLPAAFARPLARRIWAVNEVLDVIAVRHGTVHLNATALPAAYDPLMWSVDRFHPSERGHRLFAHAFLELLASHGHPIHAWPDLAPANPPPSRGASARWLATRGVTWVYDRATDLVPSLTAMAIAEWWAGLTGAVDRFEAEVRRDVARAIDELPRMWLRPSAPAGRDDDQLVGREPDPQREASHAGSGGRG